MPGKVARTSGGSKTQPPKKTTSSSSSSKTSKTASSSSVKKATPPPAKPKNVDKVDFGKVKPPKVTYDAPRMQNVLATNKVAIAEVSRTKTQIHGKIMGTQRVETSPTTNEIDLPMKAKKDLKPDAANMYLEHRMEVLEKAHAPEIAKKIDAMANLSSVIPAANHEYERLAEPIQNFCDICDAVEDFASNGTLAHLIENAIEYRSVADSYNALKTANSTLKANPEASFGQVGAAVAKAAAVGRVIGLLDNIAQKIPEANQLRIDLEAAYNTLARATDRFNLRNAEIFELAEQAGAKNIDMKYIVYPTTLAKVKSTFGI